MSVRYVELWVKSDSDADWLREPTVYTCQKEASIALLSALTPPRCNYDAVLCDELTGKRVLCDEIPFGDFGNSDSAWNE